MKKSTKISDGVDGDVKKSSWHDFETECLKKIKKNSQIIEQYHENWNNIGPALKLKFDKRIVELQRKNKALQVEIENSKKGGNKK